MGAYSRGVLTIGISCCSLIGCLYSWGAYFRWVLIIPILRYVGQTTQALHIRVNQHVHNITRKTYSSLWWHFNKDHSVEDLKVIPLQQVHDNLTLPQAERKLQRLETLWISRLATMQPLGMNFIRSDSQRRT